MRPLESLSYLLQHVATVMQRQTDQALSERLGIGMAQFRILSMLAGHTDDTSPLDQRHIADSLGQTEASISRQIKLLQERAMIATLTDPSERRRHLIMITTKGLKIVRAAEDILLQAEDAALNELSPKQLPVLREALASLHQTCCAPGKPMACDQSHGLQELHAVRQTALG
jgi:DNA-binding MarR family transcriptional regulator